MEGRHSGKHSPAPAPKTVRREHRDEYIPQYDEEMYEERTAEQKINRTRRKKRKKKMPVALMIFYDILLTGVVLCIFAMFHHVIPRMMAKNMEAPATVQIVKNTPAPETAPVPTAAPAVETEPASTPEVTPEVTPEPTPEPTPAPLTWREKFADKFTDEVVVTDNSYTSKDISITIEKVRTEYTDVAQSNLYIADIYIADIECFRTCFATGQFGYYAAEPALRLSSRAGAILAINGDYADNQLYGFLIRNGEMYYSDVTNNDICVLYYDGTMETFDGGRYDPDEIIAKSPYQTFKFGPALLDDGVAKTRFNTTNEISWENPRAAIGYYEPGHYCFVAVDGRQNSSRGLEMNRLAKLFEELGCQSAYNLDGGASAVMTFNGSVTNIPSNGGRDIGEILYIAEIPEQTQED